MFIERLCSRFIHPVCVSVCILRSRKYWPSIYIYIMYTRKSEGNVTVQIYLYMTSYHVNPKCGVFVAKYGFNF